MKRPFLLLAFGFTAITANAQKMKEADVPPAVKATFTKAYPNTKAGSWEKENGNYEAEFDLNKTDVLFDAEGKFIKESKD
jgi:hypothetical protein